MNIRQPKSHAQRGVAAVEFTIVLPVCLFLFLAVSEFGRAIMQYNTLTATLRDTTRYVASKALAGSSQVVNIDSQLSSEAGNLLAYGNTQGSGTPLLPGLAPGMLTLSDEGSGIISASVAYDYQPMLGAILPDVLGTGGTNTAFTMRAQITMRAL